MKQVEALNPLEGLDSEAEEKRKQLEEEFSYDGYKYVRGELFANLREPAITIRNGNITFNTACINGLEDVVYVNLMINEDMKRLVVKGCSENDKDALRWCVAKPDKRKSRRMTCPDFTKLLYDMMGWEDCYRYKIVWWSYRKAVERFSFGSLAVFCMINVTMLMSFFTWMGRITFFWLFPLFVVFIEKFVLTSTIGGRLR